MAVFFSRPGSRRSSVGSASMERMDSYMRSRDTILVHPMATSPMVQPATHVTSEDNPIHVGSLFDHEEFTILMYDDDTTSTTRTTAAQRGSLVSLSETTSVSSRMQRRRRASRIISNESIDNGLVPSRKASRRSSRRENTRERQHSSSRVVEAAALAVESLIHAENNGRSVRKLSSPRTPEPVLVCPPLQIDEDEDDCLGDISPLVDCISIHSEVPSLNDEDERRSIRSARSARSLRSLRSFRSARSDRSRRSSRTSIVPFISISQYLDECRTHMFDPHACKSRLDNIYGITKWDKPSDDISLVLGFVAETMTTYARQMKQDLEIHESEEKENVIVTRAGSVSPSNNPSTSSARTSTISISHSSIFSLVTPRCSNRVARLLDTRDKMDTVLKAFRIIHAAMACHQMYSEFIMDSGMFADFVVILKRFFGDENTGLKNGDVVLEVIEYKIVLHAINVLCSLSHASQKNKIIIAEHEGAESILNTIHHISLTQSTVEDLEFEDDEQHGELEQLRFTILQNAYRCLANFAFVQDNINILMNLDAMDVTEATLTIDLFRNDYELVTNMCIFLSNVCSHSHIMLFLANATSIFHALESISKTHRSEIDIQQQVLVCWGNFASDPQTVGLLLKHSTFSRVIELMEELVFDKSTLDLCLKLINIIVTNIIESKRFSEVYSDILKQSQVFEVVCSALSDYNVHFDMITSCTQTLSHLVSTRGLSATFGTQEEAITLIASLLEKPDNFSNPHILTSIFKLLINLSIDETNTLLIAKQCAIPILRATEVYPRSSSLMKSAMSLVFSLSRIPDVGKILAKRGGIAVCLACTEHVITDLHCVSVLMGIFGHFLLIDSSKYYEQMRELDVRATIKDVAMRNPYFKPIQDELVRFEKLYAARGAYLRPNRNIQLTTRDRLHISDVRVLMAGVLMRQHTKKGRGYSRLIKTDETCSILLVEDPYDSQSSKYVDVTSIQCIDTNLSSTQSRSFQSVKRDKRICIQCLDGSGKFFSIDLEAQTAQVATKWLRLLSTLLAAAKTSDSAVHRI